MSRKDRILELPGSWDIIVVGGGMTGAGVFREATAAGYKTLLLEQRDFSWGTSSRSGKLVHGGLRYLSQGQIMTTWHAVRERERLLHRYPGLVEDLNFVVPVYDRFTRMILQAGLTIYDLMALRRSHRYHGFAHLLDLVPEINQEQLKGGLVFRDARTDDARLVFRVIREGEGFGGSALNYMRVEELQRDQRGTVCGVSVCDTLSGQVLELNSRAVINATGVWADKLRLQFGERPRLRKLRGSHLLIPFSRLPLNQAVSFNHPEDHRPLYAMPWLGRTLVGTTDLDHESSLDEEPQMSREEGQYLLSGLNKCFPSLHIIGKDVLSSFAGVRPVLDTGKSDPSKESRDIVIWSQQGLITVTGGKLTTFPLLARKALRETVKWLGGPSQSQHSTMSLDKKQQQKSEPSDRLVAALTQRYGDDTRNLLPLAEATEWSKVPGSDHFWAELIWSAQAEQVIHLEDLLLRRTRLGLLLPDGGAQILPELQGHIGKVLDWDDNQWEKEKKQYLNLWRQAYSSDRVH